MTKIHQSGDKVEDLGHYEFLTTSQRDIEFIIGLVGELVCPIGVGLPWFNIVVPDRFILLDGSWLPDEDYPKLRAALDTPFLAKDLPNKRFRLPNMKGRYPYGVDGISTGAAGPAFTFGAAGMKHGHSKIDTLQATGTTSTDGSHTHNPGNGQFFQTSNNTITVASGANQFSNSSIVSDTGVSGSHNHTVTIPAGSVSGYVGDPIQDADALMGGGIYPPSIGVNWITRYK